MRKNLKLYITLLATILLLSGANCMSSGTFNYSCSRDGLAGCTSSDNGRIVGSKTGQACTYNVLGLVQWGDMSLKKASSEGKIKFVNSIDVKANYILGSVYIRKCLLVNGS